MSKVAPYIYLMFTAVVALPLKAQYAADIFRYSESNQTGTARFQGLGGNHAALGGDASTIFGNPAGLGFYNRSEISISPAVTSFNTSSKYTDGIMTDAKSNFNIAQASLVITSQPSFQRKWKRTSLGISFSRQQSFQDRYSYGGLNNKSAMVDKIVQDANGRNLTVADMNADFESDPSNGGPLAFSLPAAYYQMYLINPTYSSPTATIPDWEPLDRNSVVNQYGNYDATGANTQWNISYGGNYDDKLYVGGSVGFSRLRYKYTRYNEDNYVNSPELISTNQSEELSVTGNGANLSLGIIYKFNPVFQLGGVLTTPTWTAIKETFNQNVAAEYVDGLVSDGQGGLITPPYTNLNIATNEFVYSAISPFKGSLGGTLFFQNKGFITGTVEYVGYSGMGGRTTYLSSTDNNNFRTDTKAEIKDTFRNTVNARIGGELRAGVFRGRLGFAYIADPYMARSDGTKRDKYLMSAGVGVRNSRFFADLGATFSTYKSLYSPYILNNPEDYSTAEVSNKTVNVMLTVGTFFGR
ncbi:hypothetical protein DYBT9275_02075 [Dyadobacter sp. CECT 9275]|uniref:Outer membrane protein transport protein (OMPP1/FadL/TodX) n=1 Tax=Dyadobacter helix TaxID=2822344 RepID=A0A916NBL8_9BACT|nr:hypothetical protein [Dyadobacter sp. CECT 9275]CAG4998766.1 hypothetical protein DYBT9275_02075 [Dyadobacter sp. CECT 9275]